jgi:hypothetical protein
METAQLRMMASRPDMTDLLVGVRELTGPEAARYALE